MGGRWCGSGGPLQPDGHSPCEVTFSLPLSTSSFALPPTLSYAGIRLLSRPQGHVLALVRGPGFHSQHHAWYFSPLVSPQLCSFPISVTWDKVCAKSSISGTYHALAFLGPLNMAFTPSLLDGVIHFPRLSSDFTSSEKPSLITPSRVMGGPFL